MLLIIYYTHVCRGTIRTKKRKEVSNKQGKKRYSTDLVDLDVRINLPHKDVRADVADGAADDAQGAGKERHVAKVERRLE